jgi:hypothetical protein
MKIRYEAKNFRAATLEVIAQANAIIQAYQADGLRLTLRQLYYRFVAQDLLPNTQRSYDRLGSIVNDGRLAGLLDWNAIEDRGRARIANPHWEDPGSIIESAASGYGIDLWEDQPTRVEVWVEKQALEAVIGKACSPMDVPYFACKGYVSQSAMWRAHRRFDRWRDQHDQRITILHLGDHDPSGIDMTRDIRDRLNYVFGSTVDVQRIALNMDQIEAYGPPPNPAKLTDSRAGEYIAEHGTSSWELDALEPRVMIDLITEHIEGIVDQDRFDARKAKQEYEREALDACADRWDEVVEFLDL